mgnify:CR=1 FL=1
MTDRIIFFEEIIKDHESRFSSSPYFFKTDDEMAELFVELDFNNDCLSMPKYLNDIYKNQQTFIIFSKWHVNYEHFDGIWSFRRTLSLIELERYHEANKKVLIKSLENSILQLNPFQFEDLIYDIFDSILQYETPIRRPISRDGGYEFTVRYVDPITNSCDKICIQVKHDKKSLSVGHTRTLIGSLDIANTKSPKQRFRGIIVSINGPSPESKIAANNSSYSIDFISLKKIVELMINNKIGCKKVRNESYFDSNYWKNYGVA